MEDIAESIREIASEKEGLKVKCLSVYDPEKVAKLVICTARVVLKRDWFRKYGYDRETVISVLADYADHLGKFKELSGRIAAKRI